MEWSSIVQRSPDRAPIHTLWGFIGDVPALLPPVGKPTTPRRRPTTARRRHPRDPLQLQPGQISTRAAARKWSRNVQDARTPDFRAFPEGRRMDTPPELNRHSSRTRPKCGTPLYRSSVDLLRPQPTVPQPSPGSFYKVGGPTGPPSSRGNLWLREHILTREVMGGVSTPLLTGAPRARPHACRGTLRGYGRARRTWGSRARLRLTGPTQAP